MDDLLKLNVDDKFSDDLVDVVVSDANHGSGVAAGVNAEDDWVINAVVDDGVVTLKDAAKMLNVVEVKNSDDELDVQVDDCICPADDVLLLNDDIIKDDDVL